MSVYRIHPRFMMMVFIGGLIGLWASACGSRHLTFQIQATETSNDGNPVVIRIHQLRSDATIRATTIEAYVRNPNGALGEDQIGNAVEQVVRPGQTVTLEKIKLGKEAQFVAIVADFYQTRGDNWYLLLPVETYRNQQVIIKCEEQRLVRLGD